MGTLSVSGYKGLETELEVPGLLAIVGDMGAGKSAHLEALQLALLGKLADVSERALADGISGEVRIQYEDEGMRGVYTVPWDGGPKIRRSSHEASGYDPEAVLPLIGLGSVAAGGPVLESAILRTFGQGELAVPDSVRDFIDATWKDASGLPVLSVAGAGQYLAHCKKQAAALGRDIGNLDRRAAAIPAGASDGADLIRVNRQLATYDAALLKYGDKWARAYLTAEHKTRLVQHKEEQRRAQESADTLSGLYAMHESLLKVVKLAIKQGKATVSCPLCSGGEIDCRSEEKRLARELALTNVKLGKARAEVAAAKRAFAAVLDSAKPDVASWEAERRRLEEAATHQKLQSAWVQESITAKAQQREYQDAGKAVTVALAGNRKAALTKAGLRIDALSFPDFSLFIMEEGPRWAVETRAGPRWGSLSGAQRGSVMLAAPLVFQEPGQAGIVLLDDEELKGFSAKGVHTLLTHFAKLQAEGVISKVIVTHHSDRVKEIPKSFTIVKV